MKKNVFVIMLAAMMLFLVSCDLFAPAPDAPGSITVTPGEELITISWNASPEATGYDLYYTNDGSAPTQDSTKVTDITATSYVLSGLSGDASGKSYIFALSAKKDKKTGSLSSPTSAVKPIPILTVNLTTDLGAFAVFYDYLLLLLEVPYNSATADVEGSVTVKSITSVSLDSSGKAVLKASFDRSKYLGYALVYDIDGNGRLSPSDYVEGNGNGSYKYHYWSVLKEKSFATDAVIYFNDLKTY